MCGLLAHSLLLEVRSSGGEPGKALPIRDFDNWAAKYKVRSLH